jgi:hypothetical protein
MPKRVIDSFYTSSRYLKIQSKRRDYTPLIGPEFRLEKSVKQSLDVDFYIRLYMKLCRGLQRRNLVKVLGQLSAYGASEPILNIIIDSWVKFKFAQSVRPRSKQTYVYILKNFCDLEGQKIYDDVYEQFAEQPEKTSYDFFIMSKVTDQRYFRLLDYFYNEDPEWILPLEVFPRIDFEKSKMHLSFTPLHLSEEIIKECHDKVFAYVMKLNVRSLYMPRADVMQKYGNQRFNDGGVVRYDYEKPQHSFDSSFKYQRFLTKPLTPREVWLPGKAIKQNNAFMMTVHRQLLKSDPRYPSEDIKNDFEILREALGNEFLKFDISGFGFQYPRELLAVGNRVIQELYPCSVYDEQSAIFGKILDSVQVSYDDGSVVYPTRGIGLGYYEDLKTLIMLALLDKFDPVSVYGDQGLLPLTAVGFADELSRFSFIMNWEKVDFGASAGKTKWGGHSFTSSSVIKPRLYMESLLGAFFSRHHWERKSALLGFSIHYPDVYLRLQKRICNMYDVIWGYEFYPGDSFSPFMNGGLIKAPATTGYQRLWFLRGVMTPKNNMLFDTTYQTPFKRVSTSKVPYKESKAFSIKRKTMYKTSKVFDKSLYDYCNPELVYNKKTKPIPRSLPRWADFNLIAYHGISSGAITCGLRGEDVNNAINRQYLSMDPFRAASTGGYSITTRWRTSRPPDQEWLEIGAVLSQVDNIDSISVYRADLPQNPALMDDPMYFNDNLFTNLVKVVLKRKRTQLSDSLPELGLRVSDHVRQILPGLIKRSKVSHLNNLTSVVEKTLENYGTFNTLEGSDYGDIMDDVEYYGDEIDLVDSELAPQ